MLGGDDYTTTQEQIADLDARAVHIVGAETITGIKTFTQNVTIGTTQTVQPALILRNDENLVRQAPNIATAQAYFDNREHHIIRYADRDWKNSGGFTIPTHIVETHKITMGYNDDIQQVYPPALDYAPTNHSIKFEIAPYNSTTRQETLHLQPDKTTIKSNSIVKYEQNTTDTTITNTNINIAGTINHTVGNLNITRNVAIADNILITTNNTANADTGILIRRSTGANAIGFRHKSDGSGQYRGALTWEGNDRFIWTGSTTTLNNTTTNIQSGGTNKITTTATDTTLNNDTTKIQSGAADKITTNATDTILNNTTTNIQSGAVNKITTNATDTTLNNDTTKIQSGAADKITTTATDTTLNNTGITKIQRGGTDKIVVTTNETDIIDDTILLLTTGGNASLSLEQTGGLVRTISSSVAKYFSTGLNYYYGSFLTNKLKMSIDGTTTYLKNQNTVELRTVYPGQDDSAISIAGLTQFITAWGKKFDFRYGDPIFSSVSRLLMDATTTVIENVTSITLKVGGLAKIWAEGNYNYFKNAGHIFEGSLFIGVTTDPEPYPLINFVLDGTPNDFNTTAWYYNLGGYPDNVTTNLVRTFALPFPAILCGWSLAGDADAHSAATLTMKLSTGLAGGGTVKYTGTGSLSANWLQNGTATMNLYGNVNGFTSITQSRSIIGAGDTLYCYMTSSVAFGNETTIHLYFQQVQ